jgi:hypothetical protein
LKIPAIRYSARQGPDLAPIQTVDFLEEMIKDKDAVLFKLKLWVLYTVFEIGGTYDVPKGLSRFLRNAKEVVQWV